MKLWIGNPEKIPVGYTYAKDFEEALSFINRCKRIRKLVGEKYDDLWVISEICVPFDEVDKYAALFAYVPQERQFFLNARNN